MEDLIGAPSFSLGLDFDDTETTTQPPPDSTRSTELDDELDPVVVDSDPDTGPEPPRILRRLRRVGAVSSSSENAAKVGEPISRGSGCRERDNVDGGDDDIEEFSEGEEDGLCRGAQLSTLLRSICSSSKVPLKANGVLTPQVSTQWASRNRAQVPNAIPPGSSMPGCSNSKRPKLGSSPIRMFQLIDSDSDDSVGEDRDADLTGDFSKVSEHNVFQNTTVSDKKGAKELISEDLWKDFPIKTSHVPTPAFDEVFKEYFQPKKNKNVPHKPVNSVSTGASDVDYQRTCYTQNTLQEWKSDFVPPAHYYFLHDDPRIQNLVRSRLPNFLPLGISNNCGNMPASTSVINYMIQFGCGESSKRDKTVNTRARGNSKTARNKRKKTQSEEVSNASGNWVNPKGGGTLPKDAAKRRVHADGQSAGHWFTGPDGKKVYITKNGQELTGQAAYRHYRKESGTGFKRSRKKTTSKKKRGKG